jgi:hypothetical protein
MNRALFPDVVRSAALETKIVLASDCVDTRSNWAFGEVMDLCLAEAALIDPARNARVSAASEFLGLPPLDLSKVSVEFADKVFGHFVRFGSARGLARGFLLWLRAMW